ncbi:MAG: hypothetical protein H7069_14790 [Phormidesmis sp. FL-bin-119]|nr:hypothetical protein [Pedobacter sp.]
MILIAKMMVILFGLFIIFIGFLMLFNPKKARETLRKAGSINLINYAEITLRMFPAAGMIIYAEYSRFPEIFQIFGWFILVTSFILYLVPRKMHHAFSVKAADVLKPQYIRFLSPITFVFGLAVLYCVLL